MPFSLMTSTSGAPSGASISRPSIVIFATGPPLSLCARLVRSSLIATTFDRLLTEAPLQSTRGTDAELWARVKKAQEAWFVRGVDLPFITTPIRERATESIDTFLTLARQYLAEKF